MKKHHLCLVTCVVALMPFVALSTPATPADAPASPDTFGTATVSRVLNIDADCTLFCDIDAFPPLIGKNIPVRLEGIEIPAVGVVNQDVLTFLRQILTPDAPKVAPSIQLNNIRRGTTFCLIADIEINGKDLAQMLVEKKLARRIIRLSTPQTDPQTPTANPPTPQKSEPPASAGYVAAKSSKVFHRPTCPHAKRLDPSKTITFQTRQEAEQNGRRPCKTCNP